MTGMQTRRLFLNRLDPAPESHDVVVAIDVLRSFTTAAYAIAAGASAIYPVDTVAGAIHLGKVLPDALSTGAIAGGDPIPGFDFGNSPTALAATQLNGQALIQCTAAGVRGLSRFTHARALFAGSLVCAQATARAILSLQPDEVVFLITGEWVDRDGDEDICCADYLEALLRGETPDPTPFEARVRHSDFGRRFTAGTNPNLPLSDLDLCAQADRFDFSLRARRENGRLVLLPETVTS